MARNVLLKVRYDELKVGDVIYLYGARVKLVKVWEYPNDTDNPYYEEAKTVIRFEVEPFDDKAVEILGSFYSHGVYGGVGCLPATIDTLCEEVNA